MKAGQKWGSVTCLEVADETKRIMLDDGSGHMYYSGDSVRTVLYKLKCDCGKLFEVDKEEYKGKRRTRDCGCGMGRTEGRSTIFTVSVSEGTKRALEDFADDEEMSLSAVTQKTLRAGLEKLGRI